MRQEGKADVYIGRRFGDFAKLHKRLRTELPGKVLPLLPRKNNTSISSTFFGGTDDETSSISSISTQGAGDGDETGASKSLSVPGIKRQSSRSSIKSTKSTKSQFNVQKGSTDAPGETVVLYREEQRVSLRAFLRLLLQNQRIASSKAMEEFLTADPITLNEEEQIDIERRKDLDAKRIEEQRQFYEIARKRAQELDVYMEAFRRDIVESSKAVLPTRWCVVLTSC